MFLGSECDYCCIDVYASYDIANNRTFPGDIFEY